MSVHEDALKGDNAGDIALTGPSALLTIRQVGLYLGGISEATLYRMVSSGEFPAPLKIRGLRRWRRTDVDEWIAGLGR